ncbi:hypothetical protein [uncultured Microbulbifer sp.]|uniref:hypothetical protein n=1 Tax=uncultured Microbulbifer sp. TaxID=348147 RepID=UPI00261A7B9E|nr:hypothetical protein [uncultured Microbulbifer sp.]
MSEYSTADLLSDKEIPEVEPEATPTDEAAEPITGEPEGSGGQEGEAPKADEQDPTPGSDTSEAKPAEEPPKEGEPWTYQAVKDERSKRQAAETRVQELESQIAGNGQQADKPPAETPSWFDDPKAAAEAQRHEVDRKMFEQRAIMGQELMRSLHDDFDEVETRFWQMAEANPQITNGLSQAPNPAKFAYETAKKALELEKLQDVDAYKASIEAEVRQKVEAEFKAKREAEIKGQEERKQAILPSVSSTAAKGGLNSGDWSGPTSLEDILK